MKTVDELTLEDIKNILDEKVDWVELHKKFCFPQFGYGTKIVIYTDGHLGEMPSNEYLQEADDKYVLWYERAEGIQNLDSSVYLDGWTEELPDGKYKDLLTEEVIDFETAILRCIEDGEWQDWYRELKKDIMEYYRKYVF